MKSSEVTDGIIVYCLVSLAIVCALLCVAGAVTMICLLLDHVVELLTSM